MWLAGARAALLSRRAANESVCGEGGRGRSLVLGDDHCLGEVGRAWLLLLSGYEAWRGRGARLGTRGFEAWPEGECFGGRPGDGVFYKDGLLVRS